MRSDVASETLETPEVGAGATAGEAGSRGQDVMVTKAPSLPATPTNPDRHSTPAMAGLEVLIDTALKWVEKHPPLVRRPARPGRKSGPPPAPRALDLARQPSDRAATKVAVPEAPTGSRALPSANRL